MQLMVPAIPPAWTSARTAWRVAPPMGTFADQTVRMTVRAYDDKLQLVGYAILNDFFASFSTWFWFWFWFWEVFIAWPNIYKFTRQQSNKYSQMRGYLHQKRRGWKNVHKKHRGMELRKNCTSSAFEFLASGGLFILPLPFLLIVHYNFAIRYICSIYFITAPKVLQ